VSKQRALDLAEKTLKIEVKTRWNSAYTMLRRLLKAHQAVAAALSELSDHQACPLDLTLAQWATIKQLCDVLAPLKVY